MSAQRRANFPFYAAPDLDRQAVRRSDADWIKARLRDRQTRLIPIWGNDNLIQFDDSTPRAVFATESVAQDLLRQSESVTFLGLHRGKAVFTIDLSAAKKVQLENLFGPGRFVDLREVGSSMDPGEAAILALARGMTFWQRRHRFCGACGAPTEIAEAGHALHCTASSCAIKQFPRTDPAVIMLVVKSGPEGGQALLGRSARLPTAMYSTLAGFVEPGETLEQAVVREVAEEAGIDVESVTYRGSQPWPFPASLMVGFRARARTTKIKFDAQEMEDVRWFTKSELRQETVRLSRRHSIAYALISDWLAEDP